MVPGGLVEWSQGRSRVTAGRLTPIYPHAIERGLGILSFFDVAVDGADRIAGLVGDGSDG